MTTAENLILTGFTPDPGTPDLDDEQPITVRMTLGDYRRIERKVQATACHTNDATNGLPAAAANGPYKTCSKTFWCINPDGHDGFCRTRDGVEVPNPDSYPIKLSPRHADQIARLLKIDDRLYGIGTDLKTTLEAYKFLQTGEVKVYATMTDAELREHLRVAERDWRMCEGDKTNV